MQDANESKPNMQKPQQTEDSDALPKKGAPPAEPKSGKSPVRDVKETMYGIELRRRMLRIRLMIVAAVLVVVAIMAAVAVIYPGTGAFRGRLDRMVAETTGADVEKQGVELSAFGARVRQIDAEWPDGSMLESLRAEHITADVMPYHYFGRSFGGNELRAVSGLLNVRYPDAGNAMPPAGGGRSITFNRIGISDLNVRFGNPAGGGGAMVRDAEAAFYPSGPGGLPRAMLFSGSIDVPYWPGLILERAIVEFPGSSSRILSMRVRDGEAEITSDIQPGTCDVSGEISHHADEASTLEVVFDGFQLHSLIGEEAGRIFIGRVDSREGDENGVVRISRQNGVQMRVELVASDYSHISFHHFPFLRFLSEMLNDRWFLDPMFDEESSMVIVRDGAGVDFEEIRLTARNRMAVRGSISIFGENEITGEIELGIAPAIIDTAVARRLDGMFSPERDGFRWVTLELGGTTEMPVDNFNAQFIEAPLPDREPPPFEPLPPALPPTGVPGE